MATSEAQIAANRRNAALSTGPKTQAGKEIARANSLKHGLTGVGIVLPEADAIEVERRAAVYAQETGASGEIGQALARERALSAVRMERAADQQSASLAAHVRQVEADFVAPEGLDESEAAKLRSETIRAAMFDPSKEAARARQYEASSRRSFFRCLKELQRLARQTKAIAPVSPEAAYEAQMASFLRDDEPDGMTDEEFDMMCTEMGMSPLSIPPLPPHLAKYLRDEPIPVSAARRR